MFGRVDIIHLVPGSQSLLHRHGAEIIADPLDQQRHQGRR